MVKAILEGRKSQTRRICKPIPKYDQDSGYVFIGNVMFDIHDGWDIPMYLKDRARWESGDVLWVRETWGWYGNIISGSYGFVPPEEPRWPPSVIKGGFKRPIIYKADYPKHRFDPDDSGWKPSIYMPYTACRIWLDVIDVRVERLQDISEVDAIAEGIGHGFQMNGGWPDYEHIKNGTCTLTQDTAEMSYASLWESINGKGSWSKNPWVWVIEFKVKEILT